MITLIYAVMLWNTQAPSSSLMEEGQRMTLSKYHKERVDKDSLTRINMLWH